MITGLMAALQRPTYEAKLIGNMAVTGPLYIMQSCKEQVKP